MNRCTMNIPKYLIHHSQIVKTCLNNGLINDRTELNHNWHYNIKLKKIVLEDFKIGGK